METSTRIRKKSMDPEYLQPHLQYLSNTADRSHKLPLERVVTAWLVAELSQRLGITLPYHDAGLPLVHVSLDAVTALELVVALEDWLDCSLPLALSWTCQTPKAIARYVVHHLVHTETPLETDIRRWLASAEPVNDLNQIIRDRDT